MEEYNVKTEERKKFLQFFRVWIILAAVALIVWAVLALTHKTEPKPMRSNTHAPTQRVYDMADVLTDSEEKHLEEIIAEYEQEGTCDIILVLIEQEMGSSDSQWNYNMMNFADDFYDEAEFGYNKPFGDGALILDNWYEDEYGSQKGTWLSTSGKMEDIIGVREENDVLDAMYDYIDSNPARAYEAAIRRLAYWGNDDRRKAHMEIPPILILVIPLIGAFGFATASMVQMPGKDTTTASTYVAGGSPRMRRKEDRFLRKSVTSVKIESSGSSSGSHHGGGSAGHHTSHSGHSHGGGGRRR